MTPQTFITKWGPGGPAFHLNEEQGAQSHFIDLCDLLGVPRPGTEAGYLFEEKNTVVGGRTGYADVFKRGAFAWENKAPGKNLNDALTQLLRYSSALSNPPILVVCDRLTIRIQTQFTGHPTETFNIALAELDQPEKLVLLRRIWTDPESFRPKKTSRDITEAAAKSFATLADGLRKRGPAKDTQPQQAQQHADEVAHFLTQCLFCFFAEDVGLLPGRMFEGLVNNRKLTSDKLTTGLHNLFTVMREGGLYGNDDIPWFNGGLFRKIKVPALTVLDMTELRNAAALNWSAIDVSIFGTLFERGLDPAKRSQLGAHYTDPATIMRIVEPVLQRPLLQIWEQTALVIKGLLAKSRKKGDASYKAALTHFVGWLDQLENYRVLDPACGSGNFLFLGLKALKDIEHKSHLEAATLGLDREADLVTGPHNMLGIELNEYAAELARVTVWIGELQWRLQHGYEFKTNPVLDPLDHIECRDALLSFDAEGKAHEADWPKASVVIGNPPFLGGSKKRRELGDAYFEALDTVFSGRIPAGADLVCYWFDKSLKQISEAGLGAAGLVATNSIRGGSNRKVLGAIAGSSRIFEAWSDEGWVNDGAAVRVSLICFGHSSSAKLDGSTVAGIHADLTPQSQNTDSIDLTLARTLPENAGFVFEGLRKDGDLDIGGQIARRWMAVPNPHGRSNAEILRPLINGIDITRRRRDGWVIDFGASMSVEDAALYEQPFAHVLQYVKPVREKNNDHIRRTFWWRFGRNGEQFRAAIAKVPRYINTPRVAKHRLFVWQPAANLPDTATVAITIPDDVAFGILHSRFHELWSLRMGTWLGVGNDPRYTPTTCFETFPFPQGLTPADTAHQQTEAITGGALIPAGLSESNRPLAHTERAQAAINLVATRAAAEAIARAAKRLTDLREVWLNPPEWTQRVPEVIPLGMTASPYPDRILPKDGHEKDLAERTLTKLYNQRPVWLDAAHKELDTAVAAAYGWADYTPEMPDEEILKRLLALNLERSRAA
ncbi:DNA methyltransferase [Polaromonas sp.]|uniref:class I SAM-dependent DNA methyltransferase n=1 Tax=Polaromonas sp. TaxID=1869339 RepID=UPI002730DFC8|nr:DNA methyltransferase [Polaromonas sp.]MDP1740654.1 hypothetical protein [Polaromonas sp.]